MMRGAIAQKPYTAEMLLCVLFCALYVVSLGARPLFIPDEVRYGEIAREILASGDWIVPRLDGLLYFEKPPFGYWLNAVSLSVFGENPFAVRFPGALCVGISSLTVYFLGRQLFRSQFVAALATFVFLTTFEVQAVGTFAVLDSTFAAMLNGGIAFFAVGAMSRSRARLLLFAASGLLFAAAFLTKGFLALALPGLILVPWLIIERKLHILVRSSWIVIIVTAMAVAPWCLAIHRQEPDFWRYFFWVEHIQRFAGENAQHEEPLYFYLMFLPVLAFPWIAVLPASVLGLRRRRDSKACKGALSLMVLWTLVPFVFFSISSGKLATYVLPCFLPFSLIIAAGLNQPVHSARCLRGGILVAAVALGAAFVALLHAQIGPDGAGKFEPGEQFQFAILAGALLLAVVTLVASRATHRWHFRALGTGLAVVPILAALPWAMPKGVLELKAPVAFIEKVYSNVPPDTAIVANGSLVRAVCWSVKRDDVYLVEDPGELSYGLSAAPNTDRFLSSADFARLLAASKNVLLLCKGKCGVETLAQLPVDSQTWAYGNFYGYLAAGSARSTGPTE